MSKDLKLHWEYSKDGFGAYTKSPFGDCVGLTAEFVYPYYRPEDVDIVLTITGSPPEDFWLEAGFYFCDRKASQSRDVSELKAYLHEAQAAFEDFLRYYLSLCLVSVVEINELLNR